MNLQFIHHLILSVFGQGFVSLQLDLRLILQEEHQVEHQEVHRGRRQGLRRGMHRGEHQMGLGSTHHSNLILFRQVSMGLQLDLQFIHQEEHRRSR